MTRLSLLLTVSLGILTLSLFRFSLDSRSPFLRRRNHHRKQQREIRQGTTFSSCWSMHHVSMLRFSRPVACWRSGRYHWPIGQQPSHGVTSPAPRRGSRNRPRSTALSRQRPLTSPAALPRPLLAPSHRPAIYYSTRHIYQHHQHSATPVHSIIRLSPTSRLSLRPPLRPSHCAFHKHLFHQARHSSSKHPDDFQCHLTFKHPYRFASHSPSNGASTSRMKVSSTSTRQPQHLSHFYPLAILASQCELQCLLVPYRNASKPLHRAGFTMTQLSW